MYAIVDCNNFYCSCERLFRPGLMHKPVVVLSNNDGCIISRSDEAKALGVGMAGPYFQARHLIEKNKVAVFSSNYNLYGDLSRRVMDTLRGLAGEKNVEVYSVDEAFINLPKMQIDQLKTTALHIKKTVEDWTGIPVSVGIAPSKTLAKLANRIAKKNKIASGGAHIICSEEERIAALKNTRVGDIWGVGNAYAEKLMGFGIYTAWELATMPNQWAQKQLGGVVGLRLIKELQGIPSIEMTKPLVEKKMIATTRMFGEAVTNVAAIKEAVATYTSRAAEKLRRQNSAAKTISVFLVPKEQNQNSNFRHGPNIGSQITLPFATSATQDLIKPALHLVEQLFVHGNIYKKAGVMLSGLVPDTSIQANLFMPIAKNNGARLMKMMDNINFSHRDDILKFASSGTTRDWKMRQELRSPRYTTRWDELFELK